MIHFVLQVIILAVVLGFLYLIAALLLGAIPGVPSVFKQVVLAVLLLIFLLWILTALVPLPGYPAMHRLW